MKFFCPKRMMGGSIYLKDIHTYIGIVDIDMKAMFSYFLILRLSDFIKLVILLLLKSSV